MEEENITAEATAVPEETAPAETETKEVKDGEGSPAKKNYPRPNFKTVCLFCQ